jgi:GntR family transcriptional regulator
MRFNPVTSLAKVVGPLHGCGNVPQYQARQRVMRKAIDNRIVGPDDALSSERDLAVEFVVSRITVRKALDGLVADGLLVRRQGAGNFVSARVDKNLAMLASFSEGHASAPPHTMQRLAETRSTHGHSGRGAGA